MTVKSITTSSSSPHPARSRADPQRTRAASSARHRVRSRLDQDAIARPAAAARRRPACASTSIHPMFGPSANVLAGTPRRFSIDIGSREALDTARNLFASTTATTVEMDLDEHDRLDRARYSACRMRSTSPSSRRWPASGRRPRTPQGRVVDDVRRAARASPRPSRAKTRTCTSRSSRSMNTTALPWPRSTRPMHDLLAAVRTGDEQASSR